MKYCTDHNCTQYKLGRPKFHKHCFECGKLLTQQPEEKVYQKMAVCENQDCTNYGLSNDTNVCCYECGYVFGTLEYPPKKVCVKTAVINALECEVGRLMKKEREWRKEVVAEGYYAVLGCRQELEARIEKIREISDSQYEHACYDVQNS